MAKMFYTTDEAAQKLALSGDQLKQLVSENKLREFRDGARVMFKVDQVDKLAADRKGGSAGGSKAGSSMGLAGDSGIGLAGDSHASDVISLADSAMSPSKDDTVVTGGSRAGASKGGSKTGQQQVFKAGEVKSADTGAQTHIQPIDDQLSLEGVGSGSGLLDLTRESDDTSLGAELLDEIYPGGDTKGESGIGSASGIFVESAGGSAAGTAQGSADISPAPAAPVVMSDVSGEPYDGSSGAFGGIALASALISIVTAIIALCFYNGFRPDWVNFITSSSTNVLIFGAALLVVTVVCALIGMVVAKPSR